MESDSTLYSRNVSPVSVALRGNGGGVFSPPPGFPGFASKCHAWARRGYGSHTFGLGPRQTPEASHAGVEEMQLDEGDGEGRKGGGEFASVVNVGISVHHQGRPQATCVGAFSHQCSSESWPSRPGGGKQNGIQIAGNVIQVHPHLQPQLPSPSPAVVGSFGGVVAPSAPEIMAANGQTGWLTEFQHQQETLALANGGNVGGIARQHPGNSRQHQVKPQMFKMYTLRFGLVAALSPFSSSTFPLSLKLARSPKGRSSPGFARTAVILQTPHTMQLRLGPRRAGPMRTVELSARHGAGPAARPADIQRSQSGLPGAAGLLKFSQQYIAWFLLL